MTKQSKVVDSGKNQVLRLIVGLCFCGDHEIISHDAVVASVAPPSNWSKIRAAAGIINSIRANYSYVNSPEFQEKISGKSTAVASMLAKFASEPFRRSAQKRRLEYALANVLDEDDAFELVPSSQHWQLIEIRRLFAEISVD